MYASNLCVMRSTDIPLRRVVFLLLVSFSEIWFENKLLKLQSMLLLSNAIAMRQNEYAMQHTHTHHFFFRFEKQLKNGWLFQKFKVITIAF